MYIVCSKAALKYYLILGKNNTVNSMGSQFMCVQSRMSAKMNDVDKEFMLYTVSVCW